MTIIFLDYKLPDRAVVLLAQNLILCDCMYALVAADSQEAWMLAFICHVTKDPPSVVQLQRFINIYVFLLHSYTP